MQAGDHLWHARQGEVVVLQVSPAMAEVESGKGQRFWIPKAKLLGLMGDGVEAEFVKALLVQDRYSLKAYAYSHASADNARKEYLEWSSEELPDRCIYRTPRYYSSRFHSGWRMYYDVESAPAAPFRIVPKYSKLAQMSRGCKGREDMEHGVLEISEKRIAVKFRTIIERLIRAGLRARAGYHGE